MLYPSWDRWNPAKVTRGLAYMYFHLSLLRVIMHSALLCRNWQTCAACLSSSQSKMTASSTMNRYPDKPAKASSIFRFQCSEIEEMPHGAQRYLTGQRVWWMWCGACLLHVYTSSGHGWYPLRAMDFVKTLAFLAAISATACVGVGHWCLSRLAYLFRWERSPCTHSDSVGFLLGASTSGTHHSVGLVISAMMFCS